MPLTRLADRRPVRDFLVGFFAVVQHGCASNAHGAFVIYILGISMYNSKEEMLVSFDLLVYCGLSYVSLSYH